ncbi:MAG: hypothetical protein ABSG33_01320 [Candidatus Bathyarchaeia archaeon]|jgi:hypothetical protein
MGDLGNYAWKFNANSQSLKDFDAVLRAIREKKIFDSKEDNSVKKLLKVVVPISESIKGNLTESIVINERNIVDIMKSKHSGEWPQYRERLLNLESKLKMERVVFSQNDLQLLNDIADALDAECANLFKRMNER